MKRITIFSTIAKILGICFFVLVMGGEDCDRCYSPDAMMGKLVICGFVIALVSIIDTIRYKKTEKLVFDIANQPVLETNEATEGVSFAAEGMIVSDETVLSEYTKTQCVYFHSVLEKYVKSGKSGRWEVVDNIVKSVPFFLEDERGRLAIDIRDVDADNSGQKIGLERRAHDPKFSEIDTESYAVHNKLKFKAAKHFVKAPKGFRKSEYVLLPNTKVFVYGYVEEEKDELVLREHDRHPLIISRKSQRGFVKQFYKGKNLIYAAHVLIFAGFATSVMSLSYWKIAPMSAHTSAVVAGGVVILGSIVFTMYNRMVQLRNRVKNAWSNIEGELKRRHDLIPQVVASVKGYTKHEKLVQSVTTALRSGEDRNPMTGAARTDSHKQLLAVVEKYPDLKAAETFQKLIITLTDTEERVAYTREFYNSSVRGYNTLIQQFPFIIFAKLFSFGAYAFIAAASLERGVPEASVRAS